MSKRLFQSSLTSKFVLQKRKRMNTVTQTTLMTFMMLPQHQQTILVHNQKKKLKRILKISWTTNVPSTISYHPKYFCAKWLERAEFYHDFEILWPVNTKQSAGCTFYKYVRQGLCTTQEELRKYRPGVCNTNFHNQVKIHNKPSNVSDKIIHIRGEETALLFAYSAAYSSKIRVKIGPTSVGPSRPISFWRHSKDSTSRSWSKVQNFNH